MEISIWLYGKPNWDMDIDNKHWLDPDVFKEHADLLRSHLYRVAFILQRLQQTGWIIIPNQGSGYALTLTKEVESLESELNYLGIDMTEIYQNEVLELY